MTNLYSNPPRHSASGDPFLQALPASKQVSNQDAKTPCPYVLWGQDVVFSTRQLQGAGPAQLPMQTHARNPVHSCRTGFRNAACFSFEKMQRRPAPLICGGRTSSFLRGSCRVRALPSFPMQTHARNPVHSCRTGFRNAACFSFEKIQRRPAPLICGGRTSSFLRGSCRVRALPAD